MRNVEKEKDVRRMGYVFENDLFKEEQETASAVENWKSVMTELHEKKIKCGSLRSDFGLRKNIDTSLDSGIQQEYNSDNDEACNSICTTLNKLVEISKEQQLPVQYSESMDNIAQIDNRFHSISISNDCPIGYSDGRKYVRKRSNSECTDGLSTPRSFCSETNNLVEEVLMENTADNTPNSTCKNNDWSSSSATSSSQTAIQRCSLRHSCLNGKTVVENDMTINGKILNNQTTNDPQIIVTIDIGTSYCGFAYIIDDCASKNEHLMEKLQNCQTKQFPSILLLNSKNEFHSFGDEARNNFSLLEQNGGYSVSQWLLFEKFKFQLFNESEINRDCKIKAINGSVMPAMIVYARTLGFLKYSALREISSVMRRPISKDHVQWLLTVPITWSIQGKSFMQEAALNAGLCTSETINKLMFLYESEAAANWCNTSCQISSEMTKDYYFVVVNCGGGIVDVTLHKINDKNECVVTGIHKPMEMISASFSIEEEFVKILISIFGIKFTNLMQIEKPALFSTLVAQFELSKCECAPIDVRFGRSFFEFYIKTMGKRPFFSDAIRRHEYVQWNENGTLSLMPEFLKSIFQSLAEKIIKFLENILKNKKFENKIQRIHFVGGLIKSKIFQDELKNCFRSEVQLMFNHKDALTSVMKGSLYKFVFEGFSYSKMPHSYAIGVVKEFQNDVHSIGKLVIKDGRKWCCDLLDWLVRKDNVLIEGEVILKRYTPTTSQQSNIIINIYIVEQEDSKYVTDVGVHICGTLRLTIQPFTKTINHEISLQFINVSDGFIVNAFDSVTGSFDQIQFDALSYL